MDSLAPTWSRTRIVTFGGWRLVCWAMGADGPSESCTRTFRCSVGRSSVELRIPIARQGVAPRPRRSERRVLLLDQRARVGCGGRIRTGGLRVMSPPSCSTAPLRDVPPGSCTRKLLRLGQAALLVRPGGRGASDGIRTRGLQRDRLAGTLAPLRRHWLQDESGRQGVAPRVARFGDAPGPRPRPVKRTTGLAPAP